MGLKLEWQIMTNYYYDKDDIENITIFFEEHDFISIDDLSDIALSVTDGDIVFAHTDAEGEEIIIQAAEKFTKADFVFMSREPSILNININSLWPANIHICKYPAHNLNNYERVKLFFDNIVQRKWQLLIPQEYPKDLVAAYLLLIAEREGLVVNELDNTGLWKDAGKQFNEEAKKRNIIIEDDTLIPSEGWNHPNGDNISKCVALIRSLFEEIEGVRKK